MAYSHYEVDENKRPAKRLMDTMRKLRDAWNDLRALRGCMIQQKDGDTDFTSIVSNYGYAGADATAKEANAQASFAEIDSAFGAGDAAITQMLDRHL
jgi:hypothetical protein